MLRSKRRRSTAVLGLLLPVLGLVGAAEAASEITRSRSLPAEKIQSLSLQAGVGGVRIEPGKGETIEVSVTLKARRTTGLLSPLPDVSTLDMSVTTRGDDLRLEVDAKNIEENWVLRLPKKLLSAVSVQVGVGDLVMTAPAKRIEVAVGGGDVLIDVPSGAIELTVGTGDGTINTPLANAGRVEGTTGVGGASLQGVDAAVKGKVVGSRVSGTGRGREPIEATVGVGDLSITLTP